MRGHGLPVGDVQCMFVCVCVFFGSPKNVGFDGGTRKIEIFGQSSGNFLGFSFSIQTRQKALGLETISI